MMFILFTLLACQVMDDPGHVFSAAAIATKPEQIAVTEASQEVETQEQTAREDSVDPLFADPQADVIEMGVDKPAEPEPILTSTQTEGSIETVSEPTMDIASTPTGPIEQTVPVAAPTWRPATVKDGWRPTLIGTLMDGPTPRAILAMPSGEEKVIKAGDMLSEDGVVVMAIGADFVELAVIRSAEGRAQIENLTLSTQF